MPSSWLGVVLFFLLVAPGLLFDLLADRRRALVKESAFREFGRTILASVAFGLVGLAAVVAAHAAWPATFADPLRLIGTGADAYLEASARHVAASLGLQTLVAILAAVVMHWLLSSRTKSRLRSVSAWHAVFRERTPNGNVPVARIRTKSGTVWTGVVHDFSPNLEVADRELVLGPPLASSRSNTHLSLVPDVWERVVLRHDEIEWIVVKYVSTFEAAPSDPEGADVLGRSGPAN